MVTDWLMKAMQVMGLYTAVATTERFRLSSRAPVFDTPSAFCVLLPFSAFVSHPEQNTCPHKFALNAAQQGLAGLPQNSLR